MATRGSYVHNSMVEFSGASIVSFMQFSQKFDGLGQKDSQGLLELTQLYKQNPLEKNFIFTIYQNYSGCSRSKCHRSKCHATHKTYTQTKNETQNLLLEKIFVTFVLNFSHHCKT